MTPPTGPDKSAGRGLHIPLSPLMLGSLFAAVAGTALVIAFLVVQFQVERRSGPPGPGDPPPLPPPSHLAFFIAVAVFVMAWLAVLAAASRDTLMRRLDAMEARFVALTSEYGEHRRTEGYVEGVHEATRKDPPEGSGPGGRLRSVGPRD